MEWFRNLDSNREFQKYVEQLPDSDQDILREYLIPIFSKFRGNIPALEDRAKVLEDMLGNDDTIRNLPERRRRKVGNVIRKAIDFSHSFLARDPPIESKETTVFKENTDTNPNEERGEDNLLAIGYKQEGNKFFEKNKFKEAISCYTKAIDIDPTNAIYFSNRALCYLRLLAFECAMADAEKAVSINKSESKYHYRLALALSGLGDHERSCEILEKVCLNLDVSVVLEREKGLLKNLSGEFDFMELKTKSGKGENLEIADFIGPVIITQGRGGSYSVCGTRDLKRGEVILVSKAVAYSGSSTGVNSACNLNESMSANTDGHTTKLVDQLARKAKHSELAAHRIFHLFSRNPKEKPVPIELYRSKGYQIIPDRKYPTYSLADLGLAVKKNCYIVAPSESSDIELGSKKTARGVWYLPSFINHSCLATGHQCCIGDISAVYVNADLCTGSEITLSYIPVYDCTGVEERRELLKGWGVECHCKLCNFESDSRNTELLQRVTKIRTKSLGLSSLSENPLKIIGSPQYERFAELLSIANELQLGPRMFNAAFWHAVIALTKLYVAPNDSSIYFDFISKVEVFICELELTHQLLLWENVLSYFGYIDLPEKDKRRGEVERKYEEIKRKYH